MNRSDFIAGCRFECDRCHRPNQQDPLGIVPERIERIIPAAVYDGRYDVRLCAECYAEWPGRDT